MKNFYFFAMAAIALVSCNHDENVLQSDDAITLKSIVASPSRSVSTKLQETQIASTQEIGVFIDGTSALIADNAKFTTDGLGAMIAPPDVTYYWRHNTSVDVIAYQPYNAAYDGKTTGDFSVSTSQSEDVDFLASDLLYVKAENQAKATSKSISLVFTHLMSQIQITLCSSDLSADELKTAKVSILGTKTTATFKPTDGSLGALKGDATAIVATDGSEVANADITASAIIIPQQVAAGKFIQVEIDGTNYYYQLPEAKTFKKGMVYRYLLNVKMTVENLTLADSSITPWGTDPTYSGDEEAVADEENGATVDDNSGEGNNTSSDDTGSDGNNTGSGSTGSEDNNTGSEGTGSETGSETTNDDNNNASATQNFKSSYIASDYYQWDAYCGYGVGSNSYGAGNYGYNPMPNGTPTNSCASCPTIEELQMYVGVKAYWDDGNVVENGLQTYTIPGNEQQHKGLWLKKKAKIEGFNSNAAQKAQIDVPKSTTKITETNASIVRTSGDYFFLPAIGSYSTSGVLSGGTEGKYWSSTIYGGTTYVLTFNKNGVTIESGISCVNFYRPMIAE